MNVVYATTRGALLLALLLPAAAGASTFRAPEMHEGPGVGPQYATQPAAIGPYDAAVIQSYYHSQLTTPPAGEPRSWIVGQKLPGGAPAQPLPADLNARVSPLYGFHYVRVGDDVVLLADGTNIVAAGVRIVAQ